MKAPVHRSTEPARQRAEALVETQMQALFKRLPMLAGFVMAHDLDLTQVSLQGWAVDYIDSDELYREIADAVIDLVEERPDTAALLQGRTFARAFH